MFQLTDSEFMKEQMAPRRGRVRRKVVAWKGLDVEVKENGSARQ